MHRNRKLKNNNSIKKAGILFITIVLFIGIITPSVSSHIGLFLNKNLNNTFSLIDKLKEPINNVNPPVFDGQFEDVYLSHGKQIYYGNLNYENASGNLYVIDNTSIDSEYIWIAWILNPFYLDNTYGNGTVPQYKNPNGHPTSHTFEDLNESDMQEIKLYDNNNNLVFHARMDIIHTLQSAPSGYGVPPWGSGESQVFYGDSSYVEYNTSLAFNVNYYYNTPPYNVLTDSPTLGDQNYTLYPGYELWEHRIIYELQVNRNLFGEHNIKVSETEFPDLHASPNKIGPHYIPLTPIHSSIGDYVWEDEDKDGVQDSDESGIENVTVYLYYYYQGTNTKLLDTTTTDPNGYYVFNSLTPGDFYLKFSLLTGYGFTFPDQTNDAYDSDADVSTGETTTINLSPGENDMNWDAGIYLSEYYTLTINIDGNGSVVEDPDQEKYAHGTIVELTAVHDTGWTFDHWSGDLTGSDNPEYITMDSNKTVTAQFTISEYTLTIIINGSGCVFKDPDQETYEYGTVVELLAYPWDNWSFSHWDGDLSGSNNPEYITMDSDKMVIVYFSKNEYTLTVNVDGNGNVIKNPDQNTYEHGMIVELTAVHDTGWTFDHWSGDLAGSNNPEYITMDDNKTVTAHFIQLIPDLICKGSLSWTCKPGETVTGNFTVENIGDPESLLDWEIIEWPVWGEWSFNPSSGDDLKPEDDPVTVQVTVGAPKNRYKGSKNLEYTGELKIVNKEDSSDSCTIPVYLKIPRDKYIFSLIFSRIFERFPNLFPILRLLLQRLGL